MKRDASCPLCGAKLPPAAWLDACTELVDADLGVLAARCPACQGRLEIRPKAGCLELGYCNANGRDFDIALTLDFPDLTVDRNAETLSASADGRNWRWTAE